MIGICSIRSCEGSGKNKYTTKVNETFEWVAVDHNIIICFSCGEKIIEGLIKEDVIQ